MHLPHRTHLSICLSTYTKRKRAHSRPMAAMRVSGQRLRQMVHDAGLRPGTEERLQVVLEAARARGRLDDSFVSLFDEVLVGFLDKFTVVKKLADDIAVVLQPARPSSSCLPP